MQTSTGSGVGLSPTVITRAGHVTAIPDPSVPETWSTKGLIPRYEAYKRHQVRELLALLPPDGLREVYRAARERSLEKGPVGDPMALLDSFVTERLPLPPFHVWCHDVRQNPAAHLEAPWMADALPDRSAPLTVAVRDELLQGMPWRSELRVHHDGEGWRGHIRFTREGGERSWQTSDMLRERDVQSIVERFHEFGWLTLEAFLRSILP